ncbi:MAG: tol-pal system protein YbgF [Lautropia sp.]|nr:tol-pal system protein YbgF [Lautropia sp.]
MTACPLPLAFRTSLLTALLVATLPLSSPPAKAALFGDDEARQAVLNLRTKVDSLQRDLSRQLNDLASRQTDIEQRVERLEISQKASLARQNDIDRLKQEVAQLRGQLEDTLNQLQQAQKSQQDISADVDSRLKRFEPIDVTVDGRHIKVEPAEKREFDAALGLFRKSNFKAADQAFTDFARIHPDSPYLPTALYWQGGAQYAQGNYSATINTLQSLIQRFPDTPRKADALMLIGNAQADAGNTKAARQTFQRLGKEHPGTPAADAARERLKTM